MRFFVYILRCRDGSLYTGWTNNLEQRVAKHNDGKGAKYTRGRTPVILVYSEEVESKAVALHREWELKKLPRAEKIKLIYKN
ncbi:MAG: GIY-YIG nuclease family protein [Acidaminococcaceae bacterium]|nr:GIY-YIG nuclease family protein [Acidaminococcaceae bacterium]